MNPSVLVPLDGSDKDPRALKAAAAMAILTGSGARLIRVFEPPAASLTERMLTMGGLDFIQKRLAEASRSLTESADQLIGASGMEVTAEIAEGFDVSEVLLLRAARADIAVVVMATRAASPPDRALFGSVADRVMRECTRPVLLVPPRVEDTAQTIELRRVLVPLDGTRPSLAAFDGLFELDRERRLDYILLEVVSESKIASSALIDLADRLRASGARSVQVRVVPDIDPATVIGQTARDEGVDFIAMSPRGLSGFQRLVQGSVTEGVLRSSDLPVFLLTAG